MNKKRPLSSSRRDFVETLALAGAGAMLGWPIAASAAEPPPETPRIRLVKVPAVCVAPQFVAGELLKAEGFADVEYVDVREGRGTFQLLASGAADISIAFVAPFIMQVADGAPIVLLAGTHTGCFELFGNDRVHSVKDLKGKKVAVPGLGSSHHVFIATMAAHVGLDPRKDIEFVAMPGGAGKRALAAGTVDAYLGFPPDPQELRAKKTARVVVSSSVDRPWSQYFCCVTAANKTFVQKNPVAAKRALRAFLKATDICASDPQRVARLMVDRKLASDYDIALQMMKELPFATWRTYNPEDAVRFYALRLHEAGMIKTPPQKIIAEGTDWRFLNELKRELKG